MCPLRGDFPNNLFTRARSFPIHNTGANANAFVVLKAGATATETELRNYARDHLAHFKCPQRIQFVSELPKTATGKVQKYVLRGKPAISKQ
jgi:fatty-acyl-CoA synthase